MFAPYIDRPVATEFLTTLTQALKSPNLSPLVLHIYGVGGVGKSTLARRAIDANPQAASATIEFGRTEGSHETIRLLKALHQDLLPAFKGQPDPFGNRYNEYFDAIHKLKTESEDGKGAASSEQIETVKKGMIWAAKGLGGFTPVGSEVAGLAAEVVVEGAKLALSEKDRLVDLVQRHRATKGKRELQALILDPVPRLTDAFVESLTGWSKRQPILLILDTYEKAPAEIDNWLWSTLLGNHNELHSRPVRILVMGRHEILRHEGWRKLNQDRPGWIYERSLKKLDAAQTQDYLQRIGIANPTQIERIYKITRGLPYYLNWIRDQQQKGEPLEFVEGNEEIAKLLLQGLDEAKQRLIELAACCRSFDQPLLEFLGQQHGVTVDFAWLTQQSFVERIKQNYRLDDVARDVFRQEFHRRNPQAFERVFDLLTRYFKSLSDREVSTTAAPPDKYENEQWLILRSRYLYYLLFTRKPDLQPHLKTVWITHLLESRYFRQDELVQVPLQTIDDETIETRHPYLSAPINQWLQKLRPAIEHGWAVLEEDPIDYQYNREKFGLGSEATHQAIEMCLGLVDELTGLAKFAALLYRSCRCPKSEQLLWIVQAKTQAEQIVTSDYSYCIFDSNLFYKIGSELFQQEQYEQAISLYQQAIQLQANNYRAWNDLAISLHRLKRNEEAIINSNKAIEIESKNALLWNNRGYILSALNRIEEAISSHLQALKYHPEDYETRNDIANLFSKIGRNQDALIFRNQVVALKPDSSIAWKNRGNELAKLGDYQEALASYDQAIHLKENDAVTWINRGTLLLELENHKEALSSYSRAFHYEVDSYEAWLNLGLGVMKLGDGEGAIRAFSKAIELDSNGYLAWFHYGASLYALGRIEEAISVCEKIIKLDTSSPTAWCTYGWCLSASGRNEEAIFNYEQAIQLKLDYVQAWHNRGHALAALGRYEEAIASYDQAIQLEPDFYEAWYSRGIVLSTVGRYEDAIASHDKAIEIKPDYYESWGERGIALSALARYEEAISSYEKVIEISPNACLAWSCRGNALFELKRYEEAISSYDKALEIKPDDHETWGERGDVLANLSQYAAAINSFNRAITIQSDDCFPYRGRGFALMRLGCYDEALASFNRALELEPNWAEVYYYKACCYALMGNVIEAVDCLSRAIALDSKYRELAKTDADFDAIRGEDWFQTIIEKSREEPETP